MSEGRELNQMVELARIRDWAARQGIEGTPRTSGATDAGLEALRRQISRAVTELLIAERMIEDLTR